MPQAAGQALQSDATDSVVTVSRQVENPRDERIHLGKAREKEVRCGPEAGIAPSDAVSVEEAGKAAVVGAKGHEVGHETLDRIGVDGQKKVRSARDDSPYDVERVFLGRPLFALEEHEVDIEVGLVSDD